MCFAVHLGMGILAVRRSQRAQGSSATSTLAIIATISALGIASFTQLGNSANTAITGKSYASAMRYAPASNFNPFGDGVAAPHAQPVEIGSSSSAAIDADLTNRLIDYLAGVGSRPSEIPAGSNADKLLNEVATAVATLIGGDDELREKIRQNLRNNHGDVERILFTGVKKLDDVNEGLVQLIVESGGDLVAKLGAISNLAIDLEKNHAEGRKELQDVLSGVSIGGDDNATEEPTTEEPKETTTEEPTTEEPTTEEPTTEEPTTEEPTTEEPKETTTEEMTNNEGSLVEGNLDPQQAGKAFLDAINANPEAAAAAGALLEDPEIIALVSAALSGDLKIGASEIIDLMREKPGILEVLRALADDEIALRSLLGPYAEVLINDPTLVDQLGKFIVEADEAEVAGVLAIVDMVETGKFDPVGNIPSLLALFKDENLVSFIERLTGNPAVLELASQYIDSVYLEAAQQNPWLVRAASEYLKSATEEDLALVTEVINGAVTGKFDKDKAAEIALNPVAFAIIEKLWNDEAGRAAIRDSIRRFADYGWFWSNVVSLPIINRFVPTALRFWGLRGRYGFWSATKMTANAWLTNATGRECSGVFNMCRVKQGGGLIAAGVKNIGGFFGRLFGGGDDEPVKAVARTAHKSSIRDAGTSTPAFGKAPGVVDSSGDVGHAILASLPPVIGYTPAFPGLLERQLARIAAKRALEAEAARGPLE